MGKGDKKTAKGKRIIGSYGNVRKRKPSESAVLAAKVSSEKAEKPAAEKKPAVKKASTAKKTTTKKATSETK